MRSEIGNQLDELISKLESLRADLSWVPEIPGCSAKFEAFDKSVEIVLQYNPAEIDRVRKALEKAGYKLKYERDAYSTAQFGSAYFNFEDDKGHEINVVADIWREGSVCKRNIIGERTRPVYELICSGETPT